MKSPDSVTLVLENAYEMINIFIYFIYAWNQ